MSTGTLAEPSSAQSAPTTEPELTSRDFRFLRRLNPLLFGYVERAVEFGDEYPEECLPNIRKFAEYVVVYVESATQVGKATARTKRYIGDQERRVGRRVNNLHEYIEDDIRKIIKDIWFNCSAGPHLPKQFPLTKADARAHKEELREIMVPALQKALNVARWLQKHCSNDQSRWARMVSLFWPLPIGLKERLATVKIRKKLAVK